MDRNRAAFRAGRSNRMVRIDRVTTRGGDRGETSLGDGARLPKDAPRIEAIGAVDEANATLGLLRLHAGPAHAAALARIQNDLFDLGADLAVPGEAGGRLRLGDAPSIRLEAEIGAMNAALPPLHSFVLPGGTPGAACAHLARTVVRRAERRVVSLAAAEALNPALARYLNRLSDHLFVLARVLNAGADQLWTPGGAP
jgi:cob(I)alamin adenosyltransferase